MEAGRGEASGRLCGRSVRVELSQILVAITASVIGLTNSRVGSLSSASSQSHCVTSVPELSDRVAPVSPTDLPELCELRGAQEIWRFALSTHVAESSDVILNGASSTAAS